MTRFFHGTMTVVVLIVLGVSMVGLPAAGIRIQPAQLLPKICLYLFILAGAAFYRYRRADQFVASLMIVFWMGLVSDLHVYPMFLAGRSGVEFSDELLVRLDRLIGLEVTDILRWLEPYPWIREWSEDVYFTLVFLMALAILGTTLLGRYRAAQEYVVSCVVAVLICFPIFAVFQAHGPWVYYGYPAPMHDAYVQIFAALRSEETFTMDLGYANGLICFPSFHTILAMLAGLALRSVPYVRWVGLGWACLIILSTLTTGTHYVVDVVAGLGIGWICVLGGKAFSWFEARCSKCVVPQSASVVA
jgi:membrane-associated phospholipid phosphatase